MEIAELFVNLGVKGSDKTVKALGETKGALKEVASVSLETKAALIGAFYALERLFAASGKTGAHLENLGNLLGADTTQLQKYEWATQQANVATSEMDSTLESLQTTFTNMKLGKGHPEGLGRFVQIMGQFTAGDAERYAKDPIAFIKKIQEYALKETDDGWRKLVLSSFGVTKGVQEAALKGVYRPEILNKAPVYSEGEVKQLSKAETAWKNLGTQIEMAIGHFNAKHGKEVVDGLSGVVKEVLKAADAFQKLFDKFHGWEAINKAFLGWKDIFEGISDAIDKINELNAPETPATKAEEARQKALPPEQRITEAFANEKSVSRGTIAVVTEFWALLKDTLANATFKTGKEIPAGTIGMPKAAVPPGLPDKDRSSVPMLGTPSKEHTLKLVPGHGSSAIPPHALAPKMAPVHKVSNQNTNVHVSQTLQFQHEGKDAQRTADSVKKAVSDFYRSSPAQAQVN